MAAPLPPPKAAPIPAPAAPPVVAAPPPPAYSANYCRDFNQKIVIDGVERNAYGKACLQPDGSWRIVNLN